MKWLQAHYHACCAVARVRSIEKAFDRFRSRIFCRMQNFNVWLDSTVKHLEHTTIKVDKIADDVDLINAGQRHNSRDIVDLHEQFVLLGNRIDNLNKCIVIQNSVIRDLNCRLHDVSHMVVARPSVVAVPSKN